MQILHAVGHALLLSLGMTWEILWALILGFILSAVVQAVVRRQTITKLLGDDKTENNSYCHGLRCRQLVLLLCRRCASTSALA